MILTDEQQRWCAEQKLGLGYDDDREDMVQFSHAVEITGSAPCEDDPSERYDIHEALCRSTRLWMAKADGWPWPALGTEPPVLSPQAGSDNANISCPHCVRILFERGMPGGPR